MESEIYSFVKRDTASVDLSYLDKLDPNFRLPTIFEKCKLEKTQPIEMRVTNIYDPSKFYIVNKHKEVEALYSYMFKFYYEHSEHYKIPKEKVTIGMYCVPFIDGAYYRGIVISCPPHYKGAYNDLVRVFYVDYGMIDFVKVENLHYMNEKLYRVPQFAVRASLFGVLPYGTHTWTSRQTERFIALVTGVVKGMIVDVDLKKEKLDLVIYSENMMIPVHETLVKESYAINFGDERKILDDNSGAVPKVKYAHLFPSHEALESGAVPISVAQSEYLTRFLSEDKLYKQYYMQRLPEADRNENS